MIILACGCDPDGPEYHCNGCGVEHPNHLPGCKWITRTPPRITINVRLSGAGIEAIDTIADTEQRSRSQMVRILLAEALKARKR